MDTFTAFMIIIYAGIMHATFQLSVSVLTLLSGHALGKGRSRRNLFKLTSSFVLGSIVSLSLLISFATLMIYNIYSPQIPTLVWTIVSGLVAGIGVSVWLFYYGKSIGTVLWVPRPISEYLRSRTQDTSNSVEAFSLGVMGVLGEILFTIAPISVASLVLVKLDPKIQLAGLFTYVLVAVLPIIVLWILVRRGHKISHLQKWREKNKFFMQFISGIGLLALAVYVYVNEVMTTTVTGVL